MGRYRPLSRKRESFASSKKQKRWKLKENPRMLCQHEIDDEEVKKEEKSTKRQSLLAELIALNCISLTLVCWSWMMMSSWVKYSIGNCFGPTKMMEKTTLVISAGFSPRWRSLCKRFFVILIVTGWISFLAQEWVVRVSGNELEIKVTISSSIIRLGVDWMSYRD